MIKFNLYHVINTDTKEKARVYYSLDNRCDGRRCVTLYAKDYIHGLFKLFPANCENNSEIMTDYMETDTVRLFEDHPLYSVARATAELLKQKREY